MIKEDLNKVEGYSHLRKNPQTGGVVNVDRKAYEEHMRVRRVTELNIAQRHKSEQSINNMNEEIRSLKDEMSEIKGMLLSLMNRNQ
jgi:hypothetical protein